MNTPSFPNLDHDIAARLVRRWDGVATPDDERVLDAWTAGDDGRASLAAVLRQAWDAPGPATHVAETDQFRARVLSTIREPRALPATQPVRRAFSRRTVAALAGVAGIILAVLVGYPALRQGPSAAAPQALATYATQTGQRANITLASGDRMTLAPKTTARVFRDAIELDGEAVFTVTHNSRKPFIVRARHAEIRVLGTTFGVRGYAEDAAVRVAVEEGRVSVAATAAASRPVVMAAGDVAQVRDSTVVALASDSTGALLAWTRGALVFNRAALRDVAVQLSRWYGVDFVVRDSVAAKIPLTMTFKSSDSIDAIMHAISVTTGTTVRRDGRTVGISAATRAGSVPTLDPTPALARRANR